MGLSKTSAAAVNLLIDIGYFSLHVNLDLLKFNIRTEHTDEVLLAAEELLTQSSDLDEVVPSGVFLHSIYNLFIQCQFASLG